MKSQLFWGGVFSVLVVSGCIPAGTKADDTATETTETTEETTKTTDTTDTTAETTETTDTTETVEANVEHCGVLEEDETWEAAIGPHVVTCDFRIRNGGSLTIEAGTEVYFVANASLQIGDSGRGDLHVEGTESEPVLFALDAASSTTWKGLQINDSASQVTIESLVIRDAGTSTKAAFVIEDTAPLLTNVTIESPAEVGLELKGSGRLDIKSSGLTVTGAEIPIQVPLAALEGFPTVTLTDNTYNVVQIDDGDLEISLTLSDVGVPYWVDDNIDIDGNIEAPAVLTIDDPIELRFSGSKGLFVGKGGGTSGLIINASAAAPVVMGPWDAEIPGSWDGVGLYDAASDELSSITGLEIHYGGGGLSGNLYISEVEATLNEITLTNSENWGLFVNVGTDNVYPVIGAITYEDNESGDYNLAPPPEDTGTAD